MYLFPPPHSLRGVKLRAAVLGFFFLAACGGDVNSSAQLAASTSSTATPTTATPTTTAAPASSTTATTARATTTTGVSCPVPAIGAGATDVTTKPGDFDGNGAADVLRAYKLGPNWHLRAELAGAGGSDVVVPGVDSVSGLKALGGFNLNDTVADEAFAIVGSGASTTLVGIFAFVNCQLVRVTEMGNAATFTVGASVQRRSGISCVQGGALQVLSASTPPNASAPYTLVRQTYDVVGSALMSANTSQTILAANDPALAAASKFDCGSLTLN